MTYSIHQKYTLTDIVISENKIINIESKTVCYFTYNVFYFEHLYYIFIDHNFQKE